MSEKITYMRKNSGNTINSLTDSIKALSFFGTYGGELFGMSEQRNAPIQKVADLALRTIAGVGRNCALSRLRSEFSVNSIFTKTSCLRERAHIKWPTLRTWIADLCKYTIKSKSSTWVSGTTRWINRYTNTTIKKNTAQTILERYNKNDKTKINLFIQSRNMQTTSNWIKKNRYWLVVLFVKQIQIILLIILLIIKLLKNKKNKMGWKKQVVTATTTWRISIPN